MTAALQIRHDVPMFFAENLRKYTTMKTHFTYEWSTLEDKNIVPRLMNRYFGANVGTENDCDFFLIEGVPAASIIYNKKNDKIIVKEFHINKGMMCLFDAGPYMRKELYNRHGSVDVKHVENKIDLLF